MGRGPYETSRDAFVNCVCTTLEQGKPYTYYDAKNKCKMGYRTIHDYVTINMSDVNIAIDRKCSRSIRGERILRTYPGFRVYLEDEGGSDPLVCETELGLEPKEKPHLPFTGSRAFII